MKKTLIVVIASMFLLHAWVSAEKHAGTLSMYLVTSFDFASYPACSLSRSTYCIQSIRFYDADNNRRLAEVSVHDGIAGPQPIVATVHVNSVPLHVYAVTVYQDGSGSPKEGLPGEVSTFHAAGH